MLKKPTQKTAAMLQWGLVFLFFFTIDQVSKHFYSNEFHNYFFAFSLPVPIPVMYGIYAVAIAAIIWNLKNNFFTFNLWNKLAWVAILSGAVANVAERIVLGYVRDFIYISFYHWTGIYNLADGFIIVGVIMLLLGKQKSRN